MSKAYSKVFISSILFLALIIGSWGLDIRNADASNSVIESTKIEFDVTHDCVPEATDGLVKFELAVGDTFGLDFRKNNGTNFLQDGNVYVREWRIRDNRWTYIGSHYKRYYAGQNVLQVTDGTDRYDGVYYQTWWKSSLHNRWTYTGVVRCSF